MTRSLIATVVAVVLAFGLRTGEASTGSGDRAGGHHREMAAGHGGYHRHWRHHVRRRGCLWERVCWRNRSHEPRCRHEYVCGPHP
jgi:hypothetical protein